jgi:hypothetical protein
VARCEAQHGETVPDSQGLIDTIAQLREEVAELRLRQQQVQHTVLSRNGEDQSIPLPPGQPVLPTEYLTPDSAYLSYGINLCNAGGKQRPGATATNLPADSASSATSLSLGTTTPAADPALHLAQSPVSPRWALLPFSDGADPDFVAQTISWYTHLDLIAECPMEPSPLDLLYGTQTNYLANIIYQRLRKYPTRDPERLALGWIIYLFAKWRACPTPESFINLPSNMWPVREQMNTPHESCCDEVLWPQLRVNMIRKLDKPKIQESFSYLSCCMKVRWPWGEEVLCRNEANELLVRPEFKAVFMSLEGWGMTLEFMQRFPELVEHMDCNTILYNIPESI